MIESMNDYLRSRAWAIALSLLTMMMLVFCLSAATTNLMLSDLNNLNYDGSASLQTLVYVMVCTTPFLGAFGLVIVGSCGLFSSMSADWVDLLTEHIGERRVIIRTLQVLCWFGGLWLIVFFACRAMAYWLLNQPLTAVTFGVFTSVVIGSTAFALQNVSAQLHRGRQHIY